MLSVISIKSFSKNFFAEVKIVTVFYNLLDKLYVYLLTIGYTGVISIQKLHVYSIRH